jgi:hypothetical protein
MRLHRKIAMYTTLGTTYVREYATSSEMCDIHYTTNYIRERIQFNSVITRLLLHYVMNPQIFIGLLRCTLHYELHT